MPTGMPFCPVGGESGMRTDKDDLHVGTDEPPGASVHGTTRRCLLLWNHLAPDGVSWAEVRSR